MALAANIGAVVTWGDELYPDYDFLPYSSAAAAFGESQGRYVVTSAESERVIELAREAGIPVRYLGMTWEDDAIQAATEHVPMAYVPLADLRAAHEGFFPALMNASKAAS
jgi:phosphoribosylformylglycinamidine synthase